MKTPVHFTQIIPTLPFLSLKKKTKTKTFFETKVRLEYFCLNQFKIIKNIFRLQIKNIFRFLDIRINFLSYEDLEGRRFD